MKGVKPNMFVVGAYKCGTTALYQYLSEHPDIFLSPIKETNYFSNDFPNIRRVNDVKSYLNLYKEVAINHKYVGEVSPSYLYSKVAIKNIYNFNPDAKIIVILRNPVEMVYSLHSQLYYTGNENVKDFEKAWMLKDLRKRGKKRPKFCKETALLQYGEVAKFGSQLERLYSIFPYDQVKVLIYDDLKKDPKAMMEELYSFLNLICPSNSKFSTINKNKEPRIKYMNPILRIRIPMSFRHFLEWTKIHSLGKNISIRKILRDWNKKEIERKPLEKYMWIKILKHYSGDIQRLESVLNRDSITKIMKTRD